MTELLPPPPQTLVAVAVAVVALSQQRLGLLRRTSVASSRLRPVQEQFFKCFCLSPKREIFGNVRMIERILTTLGNSGPWRAMATKQKHFDQLFNDVSTEKYNIFSNTTK